MAVPEPASDAGPGAGTEPDALVAVVKILNAHGLHARPAARLVQEARFFDARVELRNLDTGAGPVPATSLSRVATLGALCGHRVELSATGSQAREARDHLVALAERRFDEAEHAVTDVAPPARSEGALAASPGIAIGPAFLLSASDDAIPDEVAADPAAEWRRVRGAIAEVRRDLQRIRAVSARENGEAEARIFDAHLMLLDHTDLVDDVRARIDAGAAAPRAWADATTQVESQFARLTLLDRALALPGVVNQVPEEERHDEQEWNAQHVALLDQDAQGDVVRHRIEMRDDDEQRRADQ